MKHIWPPPRNVFCFPLTLISLTLGFAFSASFAPGLHAEEFSQVSHHTARLFSYGTLVIDSRTGDLRIEGWDEPRVEIEAEKVVRAGSEATAKPLYDQVQVRMEGSDKE